MSALRIPLAIVLTLLIGGTSHAARTSQVYTVEVRPTLTDVNVAIDHVAQSTMLVMRLTNNGEERVRCTLNFDASPQTPRRATVFIAPGRTEQSVLRAQRRWFSVIVDVECRPAPR
jgi:hypothetical protein